MATFVLVHGAWHGGWCWRDVAAALRAQGHDVLAPTLSGVAERARLAPHADLSLHVEELAGLLYFADVREVVLVGHSYGGLVVSGAAARASARLARLVYLDAFVADAGQSLFDLLRPERREVYESTAIDGLIPSPPPEVFGVTEPRLAAWTSDRLTPQPLPTWTEPLAHTSALPDFVRPLHRGPARAELRTLRGTLRRRRDRNRPRRDDHAPDRPGHAPRRVIPAHNWHSFGTNACRAVSAAAIASRPMTDVRHTAGQQGEELAAQHFRAPRIRDPRPQPPDALR